MLMAAYRLDEGQPARPAAVIARAPESAVGLGRAHRTAPRRPAAGVAAGCATRLASCPNRWARSPEPPKEQGQTAAARRPFGPTGLASTPRPRAGVAPDSHAA